MVDFILLAIVCLTIFALANGVKKQMKVKPLQPIRIETEEELRRKRLLQQKRKFK